MRLLRAASRESRGLDVLDVLLLNHYLEVRLDFLFIDEHVSILVISYARLVAIVSHSVNVVYV